MGCDEYYHEWCWDSKSLRDTMQINQNRKAVRFLKTSTQTVAVVGDTLLHQGCIYYWELIFGEIIYGTDTMVGIGTKHAKTLQAGYCSLLGCDENSWGYSYRGYLLHKGVKQAYKKGFCKNDVIGILLDTWHGTLKFYINGNDLGVAFNNINCSNGLYPMVSSTAAKSFVRINICDHMRHDLVACALLELIKSIEGLEQIYSEPGLQKIFRHYLRFIKNI